MSTRIRIHGERKSWMARLLGLSVLLLSYRGEAEQPGRDRPRAVAADVVHSASEWQKGRTLVPTQQETLRLSAGTSVAIAAHSTVVVQSKMKLLANLDGLNPMAFAAQLTAGRLDINVDPRQKPAHAVFVYGPRRSIVLVRGGRVSVTAQANGVAVGVYAGKDAASIGSGSNWRQVAAGRVVAITAEAPQGIESNLLPAPQHVALTCPVLAISSDKRPISRAEWLPIAGATAYRVELVNQQAQSPRITQTSEPSIALRGLQPGRHLLRVAAVDVHGLSGTMSDPISVDVVGLVLPPGAFVSQGRVFLEPQQQLTLTQVDGLEASYDGAPIYFKASSHVGLRGSRPTTLHLRFPGAAQRTSLELLPRDLHARVEITPALARWPRDKVVVRIESPPSFDGLQAIELNPSVTVNSHPTAVTWTKTEQGLETVLAAPPIYPGPWVLRVEVTDQNGIALGRGFLEIASTAGIEDEDAVREIHRGP